MKILLGNFVKFMKGLDLETNYSKTFVMMCGPRNTKTSTQSIEGKKLDRVSSFPYLGLEFDDACTWSACLRSRLTRFSRAVGTIFSLTACIGRKPLAPLIEIYKRKCLPSLTYGIGVWV